jgi:hypothetical protein
VSGNNSMPQHAHAIDGATPPTTIPASNALIFAHGFSTHPNPLRDISATSTFLQQPHRCTHPASDAKFGSSFRKCLLTTVTSVTELGSTFWQLLPA